MVSKYTWSGALKWASRSRTKAVSSASDRSARSVLTKATGRSPQRGSGRATTAASITSGWAASAFSTSTEAMFSPPLMMMSLLRSVSSM